MTKAAPLPAPVPASPPDADPDLVSLSKRLTQRAAAGMARTPRKANYAALSPEAEADHIAALKRYITSKEAIVARFRAQLAYFPHDIDALRGRLARADDPDEKAKLAKNLDAYCAMRDTLQHRVEVFDATWPDRKAEMLNAIESHRRRLGGNA